MNELQNITEKLLRRQDLNREDVESAIDYIAANNSLNEVQVLDFLNSTNNKEISAEELFYFVSSMRKYSRRVITEEFITDSCGTGADMSSTINISTISAIAASTLGLKVIKQTNSSITSACGSTNLLKELNIPVVKTPEEAVRDFKKNGIAFVHSPNFNGFAEINNIYRQKLGKKTIFNYLGPLINPVNSKNPNMDEISLCAETDVTELKDGKLKDYTLSPEDFGLKRCKLEELQGGNSKENANFARKILTGKDNSAKTDIILLNASAMLYLGGGKCYGSIGSGISHIKDALVNGKAAEKLTSLTGSAV